MDADNDDLMNTVSRHLDHTSPLKHRENETLKYTMLSLGRM